MSFEGLHPEYRELIKEAEDEPQIRQMSPRTARRRSQTNIQKSGLLDNPRPVGGVDELTISGPGDDIPLRIYQPTTPGPYPVMVWFHGGGWVIGSLDAADPACRYLSSKAAVTVVSVEYRLAPEHPFPEPLKDAYCVLEWVANNFSAIDGDGNRIGVGGVSAGANLAAAVAILSRDRDGPDLAVQVLGVPPLDSSCNSQSHTVRAEGGDLTTANLEYLWDSYLASDIDARNPYASPLQDRDLTGLPPSIVLTGEYDPLRDDGIRYAERLSESGRDVIHHHYDEAPHGVLDTSTLVNNVAPTQRAFEDLTNSIRSVLKI